MTYSETHSFVTDIQKVLKKHNLVCFTGKPEQLNKISNGLDGFHFFITKGEKNIKLRGGDKLQFESSVKIKLGKVRNNNNVEEDGN